MPQRIRAGRIQLDCGQCQFNDSALTAHQRPNTRSRTPGNEHQRPHTRDRAPETRGRTPETHRYRTGNPAASNLHTISFYGDPNGAQMEPGGAPIEPSGAQMELKWSPMELKWSPVELKWSYNGAIMELSWKSNASQMEPGARFE